MSVFLLGWLGRITESPLLRRLLLAGGILLLVFWVLQMAEERGGQQVRTEVIEVESQELIEQVKNLERALNAAAARAAESAAQNRELERQIDAIISDAQNAPERDRVVIPRDFTDRLRGLK